MWFESLTGFREDDVIEVASQFVVDGERITSLPNQRVMTAGRFEMPTLRELRHRSRNIAADFQGRLRVSEIVADVRGLHCNPVNAGSLFQVASQFNTLEIVSPRVVPEDGIDRYESDRTQGPACAVACGAGTISFPLLAKSANLPNGK